MDHVAGGVPVKALVALLALAASEAHAGSLSLGASVGVPGSGSGLPVGGEQLPFGLLGRYALGEHQAIAGGLGTPIAGVGASGWAGLELRVRPLRSVPRVAVYVAPGLRTGFVGPGYYARHSDVFVGFEYIYSGPWTIAPRAPVGVAVKVGSAELVLEALVEAPLLPGPELLFGASLGVRITVW